MAVRARTPGSSSARKRESLPPSGPCPRLLRNCKSNPQSKWPIQTKERSLAQVCFQNLGSPQRLGLGRSPLPCGHNLTARLSMSYAPGFKFKFNLSSVLLVPVSSEFSSSAPPLPYFVNVAQADLASNLPGDCHRASLDWERDKDDTQPDLSSFRFQKLGGVRVFHKRVDCSLCTSPTRRTRRKVGRFGRGRPPIFVALRFA